MKILAVRKRRRGFLLMEVVLAMMIFAVMSVGFTRALSAMRKNSRLVSEQMQIAQVVDSALTEALTLSSLEEGETLSMVGENNMEVLTVVEPLELENEEGRVLQVHKGTCRTTTPQRGRSAAREAPGRRPYP